MFGISPIGWVHTLGSLPAIPAAAYMLLRYGRIEPRSLPGKIYFVSMIIGAVTVFLVAHEPVSYVIGLVTLLVLLLGYSAGRLPIGPRFAAYLETITLSFTVFFLMVPTVTEVLKRVPDGHPLVTDMKSPLLVGAQGGLLVALLVGLTIQVIRLRRQNTSRSPWEG